MKNYNFAETFKKNVRATWKRLREIHNRFKTFYEEKTFFAALILSPILSIGMLLLLKLMNFLNITSTSTVISALTAIASVLASIIGIIVAILLVSFELLRRTYGSFVFRKFFQDSAFKFVLWSFISTIVISIITAVNIGEELTASNLWLFKLSLFLFIFCLLILPFSIQEILQSVGPKRKIKEIISKINTNNTTNLSMDAFQRFPSTYISNLEENPILVLSEAAIQTIKDNDLLMSKFILFESANKLLELLQDNIKNKFAKRNIINSFLIIFRHSAEEAFRQSDETILINLLDVIKKIHVFCAKNKVPLYEVVELNEMLQEILEKAIKNDFVEVGKEGLWTIQYILKEHLENNVPLEEDVWSLHVWDGKKNISHDSNKNLQWNYISRSYIHMLYGLVKKSIESSKAELVGTGLFSFEKIAYEAVESTLGNLQKKVIVDFCYYYIKSLMLECVNSSLYDTVSKSFAFDSSIVNNFLDKKAEFSKKPLIYFGDTLIQLAQKNVLDTFTLNNFGAIGRGLVDHIDDNFHKEALLFIIEVFNKIREVLENNSETTATDNIIAYIETYGQVESFKKWIESKNKHDNRIEEKISLLLNNFKKLEKYKQEYEDEKIKWPNLNLEENKADYSVKNKKNGEN